MTQPRRPDEIALYARLRAAGQHPGIPAVEDAFAALGIPEKRGYYLLDKWCDKGWWDYGFTDTAPEALTP